MKKSLMLLAILFSVTTALSAQTKKQTGKSKSITADTTLANEYFKMGEKLSREAKYDSSIIFLDQAATIYDINLLFEQYIKCQNSIGRNLITQGNNHEAIKILKKSLVYGLEKLGRKNRNIANTYGSIGSAYSPLGDFKNALAYNDTALQIRIEIVGKKGADVAASYANIGIIYDDMGEYDKAIDFYLKSLEIKKFTLAINHPSLSNNYNNLSSAYKAKGDYDKALQYGFLAFNGYLNSFGERHPYIGVSSGNLGTIYFHLGDYEQSIKFLDKAKTVYLETIGENNLNLASVYNTYGAVYSDLGDLENALYYFNKTLNIIKTAAGENNFNLAECYTNIALIMMKKQEYNAAIENINRSLSIRRSTVGEEHIDIAKEYLNLANLYRNSKQKDLFLENYTKSLQIRQRNKNGPLIAETLQELATFQLEDNDPLSASTTCQNAISYLIPDISYSAMDVNIVNHKILDDNRLLEILQVMSFAYKLNFLKNQKEIRYLKSSIHTYEIAVDLIDKIRRGYKAEGSKLFLGKKAAEIYENAIRAALTMYNVTKDNQYKEKSFFFAEKNRANVLLDAMADSRAKSFGDIPDSLLEQEKNMKIDLSFYDTQIQREQEKTKDADSAKLAEYQDKAFDLNRQYQSLIDTLEKRYPRYYELKYQTSVASVSDIQKNLDDNTALIEYFTGDSNLYVFTITKNDFQIHSAKKDTSFNSLVKRFYASIRKSDRADYAATNYELYKKLILPVEKQINKKEKWIIIPDGSLYYVPFEAMIVKPSKSDDYASLPYLIKERDVRYHYSATLWSRDSDKKQAHEYEFAGFAPVFSDTVKNGRMIGQNFSVLDTMNPGIAYRSVDRGSNTLSALPKSEDELLAIVRAFENRKKSAVGYLHREASEEHFKAGAASARILHVATHGLINEKKPKLSALAFSQPEDSLAKEDGLLYAGEIYNLKTSADLVVLSSCESGLGEVVRGEGMMALTRGFIYAGTDHIVTSLWKVLDNNAHALMTSMYSEMLSGRSYSESLRRAKLAMIKNPKTNAPSQWSAFVLFGK